MEQNKSNPLDFELCDDGIADIYNIARDEYFDVPNEVFFFGQIVDDYDWIDHKPEEAIDDESFFAQCPECSKVFKLEDQQPLTGENIGCPYCNHSGTLYDFRDETLAVDDINAQQSAVLQAFEKGFVLRLFDVSMTYEDREYDNYTTLSAEPAIAVTEVGREYWCEGKFSCYTNLKTTYGDFSNKNFVETDKLEDGDYYIVNYNPDFDNYGTGLIYDIQCEKVCPDQMFLETVRYMPYNAFCTLKKYGFHTLAENMVYTPDAFTSGNKISEILNVDYNQIKAHFDIEFFDYFKLIAARALKKYDLPLTPQNVDIMENLNENALNLITPMNTRRTFKYLRNQTARVKSKSPAKDYGDYLTECQKLGYDLNDTQIIYPTNLTFAHARTSALVKLKNTRETETAIKNVYEKYHGLCEWSDGIFSVIMPKSCEEIIHEGAELKHCVGGYCERMAKGEDIVLFLRRNECLDKCFYTMEIKPSLKKFNLVQNRGYENKDESEDIALAVKTFLSRYENWFNTRPADIKKDCMTRKYYKAVTKTCDGKYISNFDSKTEYVIGEEIIAKLCDDPDKVAVQGIHVASLKFAQNYGDQWTNCAILEIEVNLKDVIIPNTKDQIRTDRGKVLREVPMSEMGEWGQRHMSKDALQRTA